MQCHLGRSRGLRGLGHGGSLSAGEACGRSDPLGDGTVTWPAVLGLGPWARGATWGPSRGSPGPETRGPAWHFTSPGPRTRSAADGPNEVPSLSASQAVCLCPPGRREGAREAAAGGGSPQDSGLVCSLVAVPVKAGKGILFRQSSAFLLRQPTCFSSGPRVTPAGAGARQLPTAR